MLYSGAHHIVVITFFLCCPLVAKKKIFKCRVECLMYRQWECVTINVKSDIFGG